MDPDVPPAAVPFYRRGGFWLAVASIVPLVLGGAWAIIDHHGRQYAADVHARMAAEGYRKATLPAAPVPVLVEQNFCAHPMIDLILQADPKVLTTHGRLLNSLHDRCDMIYPEFQWHGPELSCPARTWGALELFSEKSFASKSKSSPKLPVPLAASLKALCPEAPRSTRALARYIDVESGTEWSSLEARLALPGFS